MPHNHGELMKRKGEEEEGGDVVNLFLQISLNRPSHVSSLPTFVFIYV